MLVRQPPESPVSLPDPSLPALVLRRHLQLTKQDLDHPIKQCVLVRNVVVERHRLDAKLTPELPHRESLQPLPVHKPYRSLEYPLPAQRPPLDNRHHKPPSARTLDSLQHERRVYDVSIPRRRIERGKAWGVERHPEWLRLCHSGVTGCSVLERFSQWYLLTVNRSFEYEPSAKTKS